MTVIFDLLFILYTLFIILAVIALLYATPMLIEKVLWLKSKTDEEKVLATLPVHIIIIILAVTSVWKFQQWKTHYEVQKGYEQIRAGYAPIAEPYYDFLARDYPKLGKAYRRVVAEKFIIDERIGSMASFQRSLKNQDRFINNVLGRWGMMSDQLKVLKASIETKAKPQKKSTAIAEQLNIEITQEINQTFTQVLENKKRIDMLMTRYAEKSTHFLTDPTQDDPGYPVSSLAERNYYRVISFFLAEHSGLIAPLDLITQKIRASSKTIAELNYQMKKKSIRRRGAVDDVLFEWEYTKEYSHLRLLKILYAIETQYVLQEMGMQDQHPAMQKLKQEIAPMTKYYSQKVHDRWLETKQNSNPDLVLALH